ncbi:MAG: Hsp20/alpha crystallin family protein [Candidatus Nanosalina sp.]
MRRLKRRDDVDDLFKQMENLFSQFHEKGMDFASELSPNFPVDIAEEDGEYVVTADMPGVDKEEINIKADNEGVEISAESSHEIEEENEKYYRKERSQRQFNRRVKFPSEVDAESIEAEYEDGVLTITADKDEEEGRDVEIQ